MRVRLFTLLGVLLLLSTASAQLPISPGEPITISSSAAEATVSVDESATFELTVARPGPASGTPLDALGAGDVAVTASGAPEGWMVAIDPSGFSLNPGDSRSVSVTISIEPGAEGGAVDITFTASLTTPDPTNLLQPDGSASTVVEVTRADSSTRQLLETLGAGVWAILALLALAIVVIAVLAGRSRRGTVRLDGPVEESSVAAGGTVSVPFTVHYRGKDTDRIVLHANSGDDAWSAELPVGDVSLGAGEQSQVNVAVTAPKKAPAGSRVVVRIVAVGDNAPRQSAVLPIVVRVAD